MIDRIRAALLRGGALVDITTIGRKSGGRHRTEVRLHNVGGQLYISGSPGKRDWYANVLARPEFTLHLKRSVVADLDAYAVPVLDEDRRRKVFRALLEATGWPEQLEARLTSSPLVHVSVELDGARST